VPRPDLKTVPELTGRIAKLNDTGAQLLKVRKQLTVAVIAMGGDIEGCGFLAGDIEPRADIWFDLNGRSYHLQVRPDFEPRTRTGAR
jgi:hypothetical protein